MPSFATSRSNDGNIGLPECQLEASCCARAAGLARSHELLGQAPVSFAGCWGARLRL